MIDAEQRVRDAFSSIRAPEELVSNTLQTIENLRAEESAAAAEGRAASGADGADVAKAESSVSDQRAQVAPPRFKVVRKRRRAWLAAACLLLALVGVVGFGVRDYLQPTAYVGIDMNPSIELAVNRYDVVVQARGVNDDGQAVLDEVDVKFMPFDQALDKLTGSSAFAAYAREDSLMEIAVTSDDEQQALQLCAQGDTCLAQTGHHGSCHVAAEADRQAALEAGMGVARYQAAQELLALDPDLTLEDCKSMPMRELRDRIAACEGDEPSTGHHGQGMGNGNGAGHGSGTVGNGSEGGNDAESGQGTVTGNDESASSGRGYGYGHGAGQGTGRGNGAESTQGTSSSSAHP